jgi:CheY-like chemotaxis protein
MAAALPDMADERADRAPGGGGATTSLRGRRVLVAEDEVLVAMGLEAILDELGCVLVGPASTREAALKLAEIERLDAAILDINLHGRASFPVADLLAGRGVPVIYVTGYGDLPEGRRARSDAVALLRKPLAPADLASALRRAMTAPGERRTPPARAKA